MFPSLKRKYRQYLGYLLICVCVCVCFMRRWYATFKTWFRQLYGYYSAFNAWIIIEWIFRQKRGMRREKKSNRRRQRRRKEKRTRLIIHMHVMCLVHICVTHIKKTQTVYHTAIKILMRCRKCIFKKSLKSIYECGMPLDQYKIKCKEREKKCKEMVCCCFGSRFTAIHL